MSFPLMLTETHRAANKIKAGKAPGSFGVYPEYILHGDTEPVRTIRGIFTHSGRTKLSQTNGTKV